MTAFFVFLLFENKHETDQNKTRSYSNRATREPTFTHACTHKHTYTHLHKRTCAHTRAVHARLHGQRHARELVNFYEHTHCRGDFLNLARSILCPRLNKKSSWQGWNLRAWFSCPKRAKKTLRIGERVKNANPIRRVGFHLLRWAVQGRSTTISGS